MERFRQFTGRVHGLASRSKLYTNVSEKYEKTPFWFKATSAVVIGSLLGACATKAFGSVSPTPEGNGSDPGELAPGCDANMLEASPDLNLDEIDPRNLPVISEQLVGPTGVGAVTSFVRVENPTDNFVTNVRNSTRVLLPDLDANKVTVAQFGMKGENDLCSPFVLVLGPEQADGKQVAFAGFSTEQIDANKDGVGDFDVLVPPFGGRVTKFLEIGQVDANPEDPFIHLGTIDSLDPEAISPMFSINTESKEALFLSPFYLEGAEVQPTPVPTDDAGFFNASFTAGSELTEISDGPTLSMQLEKLAVDLEDNGVFLKNENGTWNLYIQDSSDKLVLIPNDTYSFGADGLKILFEEGTMSTTIALDKLDNALEVRKDSLAVFKNDNKPATVLFYKGEWLAGSKYVEGDVNKDVEMPHAKTWDEMRELARVIKLFLPEFDEDTTYFPPLDKLDPNVKYSSGDDPSDPDFAKTYPFGSINNTSENPFKFPAHIFLEKNEDEGRTRDGIVVLEQVYNPGHLPDELNYSVLMYGYNPSVGDTMDTVKGAVLFDERVDNGSYILPLYGPSSENFWMLNAVVFLKQNGYFENGKVVGIEPLINEWFTTGRVPDELENLLLIKSWHHLLRN